MFTPRRFALLLALLVFAMFPQVLLGLQTFVVRDYAFFSYPLAYFQRECFWHGELPFWNPYNQCGVPFLAQWNTMPLYPPSLLYLTLPLEWSLSFFCLLHLWFAGLGMFFLARRWTGNNFAASFAGVAFSFNGFTLNLLIWPSHIATFSWMPWVVLAVELAWREGGRKIFLAAIVGALQMLAGGPETIFLTWLLLLALWVQQLVKVGRNERAADFQSAGESAESSVVSTDKMSAARCESARGAMFLRFPLIVAVVFALSAAQLLPFLDLVAHSQRETGYADLRWSMPAWGWANFFVPMVFGYASATGYGQYGQSWTTSYYPGLGTLWLAVLAVWLVRERRVRLLGIAAVIAFIFALGENTPIYPALRKIIPQLSFITYPVKYIGVAIFCAPLLAAFALARFFPRCSSIGGQERGRPAREFKTETHADEPSALRSVVAIGAIMLALIAGIVFWAWRFPFPTDNVHATLLNGLSRAIFLILIGAALLMLIRNAKAVRATNPGLRWTVPVILIFVVWLDVLTHEPNQNPSVPLWVYSPGMARAKLELQPSPSLGGSRLMLSPVTALGFIHSAISDPQNNFLAKRLGFCADVNLLDAMPKVDGFFSLTPRESDDLITSLYYSAQDASYPNLNAFMGVSQITSTNQSFEWLARTNFLPLITAGQQPVFLDAANTLSALTQSNFDGSQIVFLPPETKSLVTVSNQTSAKIFNPKFGNQTVNFEVQANEPSLAVVAQTYYHNWRAYVDGQPTPLLRANHAFQAVQVAKGTHQVRLAYEDRAFEIGAVISGVAWLGCLSALLILRRRQKLLGQ